MPSLAQTDTGQRLIVLQKGESGSGKTIGACSFATERKQFYTFDFDQRMESVIEYFKKHSENHLKWNHFDTYYRFEPMLDKLESWAFSAKPCPYGGIVISSITTIAKQIFYEQIMDRVMRVEEALKNNKEPPKMLKLGDIPVGQIEDYKAENTGLSTMMSLLRAKAFKDTDIFVDAHVMVHFQKSLNDDKKQEPVKPTRRIVTAGQAIAAELPVYFNNIWHYYQDIDTNGRPRYTVMFRPTQEVKTEFNDFSRASLNALPDKLEWTNKLLGEEVRKLIPLKSSGF